MALLMYNDLLRIKAFREQTAANEVTRHKRLVKEQTQALQAARDEAARFQDYRIEQEKKLFEEIKGRTVVLRDLENMKQHVALLREKEALLDTKILDVEKQLTQAEQALEQARKHHMETVREHEKFKQFIEVQWEAERREQESREEQEVEEVAAAAYHPVDMVN